MRFTEINEDEDIIKYQGSCLERRERHINEEFIYGKYGQLINFNLHGFGI
jgi:hypothetical protein